MLDNLGKFYFSVWFDYLLITVGPLIFLVRRTTHWMEPSDLELLILLALPLIVVVRRSEKVRLTDALVIHGATAVILASFYEKSWGVLLYGLAAVFGVFFIVSSERSGGSTWYGAGRSNAYLAVLIAVFADITWLLYR